MWGALDSLLPFLPVFQCAIDLVRPAPFLAGRVACVPWGRSTEEGGADSHGHAKCRRIAASGRVTRGGSTVTGRAGYEEAGQVKQTFSG